ncbi:MAG: PAS domain S-box protein [Candidatus Thiodiazotropha sp. (ex. Lucinisca nassula)]|nr:PAS domain S-box protein [Candidatus Thiodiazotropha sp. (ex. Lucinisca nassula)]MBW9271478.1 PAS domain S-box protein [Candidatus Thiodiazotropha sp. (ex. Lucinisca nassula)]
MRHWSLPSLKLTIPAMIIVFSGFVVVAFYTYNLSRTAEHIKVAGMDRLFQRLSHLQGTLEYLMRHEDIAGMQREIAALGSQESYKTVVLTDDAGSIIACTRRSWLGWPVTAMVPAFDADEAAMAVKQRSAHVLVTDGGATLAGYAGIAMAPSPAALRPDRFGQLYIQYDLRTAKRTAHRQLFHQSLFWSLIISVLALLLWLAFHLALTRRAEKLIEVAERLAVGDLSARSALTGRDELARISWSLDRMVERIHQGQQELAQDIRKREQAELAVRESEARLQQILNGTTAVIYVRDRDEQFLLVNHEFERLLNTTQEQVVGKTLEEVFPAVTAREFRTNDFEVFEHNSAMEFEEHVSLEDGVHTYLSIKFPLYDTSGRVYAICGFSTDITQRKLSESALRSAAIGVSQAKGDDVFQTLVNHLAEALGADIAFIGTLKSQDCIQTRVLHTHGRIEANITYPLQDSPCENVVGQKFRFYPDSIQQLFPEDTLLQEIAMESYAAVPLFGSTGQVLGLIAVLHGKPLADREQTKSILQIFAGRAASELERERADYELRQSEASYKGLFDASEDCIFIHDIESGTIVDVNPKACLTYGYSREEFRHIDVGALSSGEGEFNQAGAVKKIELALTGESVHFEWHRKNRDGSLHWDEVFLKRVQLAGVDRILAMTREITARKQFEQSLRDSEKQYREANARLQESEALKSAIIENALLAVVSMDDNGRIVDFNPAAEIMFGYTRTQVKGQELAGKIIPERFRESHRDGLHYYQETSVSNILGKRMELTAMRSDGREFPVELSISATHTVGVNYFTAFIADLTEKQLSEVALRASEEQYRAIFRASTDGLALWRYDGTIVDMNPAFCDMHGYTRKEFLQLSPADFIAPESMPAFEKFTAALQKGVSFRTEARGRRKDGTEMDLDVRATPILYRGKPHQLTILRDISESKRVEQARRKLEIQLRQSQKMEAIGHLTGGIAHDFNNLLTTILGYCTLSIEQLELKPDEKLQRYLEQIEKSSKNARDLIKQMLTFSRRQRGTPKPLLLAPLIQESCKMMRSTIPSSIEFRITLDKDLPPVMLDPIHVEQIMMNLCINARDAMENRGVLSVGVYSVAIDDGVCTACRKPFNGNYVALTVEDSGTGMPPEIIDRIFEPFFTSKEIGKGTGMGLSTVHGIVHEHEGHIIVKTEVGRGSEFSVLFPALPELALADNEEQGINKSREQQRDRIHVLVVDDEVSVARLMHDLLDSRGMNVTVKTDSLKALQTIKNNPLAFDLVITDQTMPGQTGIELAIKIQETNKNLPIILYSGHSDYVPEEKIHEYGIRALLNKPVNIEDLFSTIKQVLSSPG